VTFAETLVARVTGLPKKRLAQARRAGPDIVKGRDWDLENSCVVYSADGLKKICEACGVDAAALHWPAPSPADVEPADGDLEETDPSASTGQPPAIHAEHSVPAVGEASGSEEGAEAPALENHLAAATVAAGVEQLQTEAPLFEITVTRLAPNPRVVFGRIEGRTVTVGVRDNKNFIPGMKLKAHRADGDLYRMFGNCPRWPGRW